MINKPITYKQAIIFMLIAYMSIAFMGLFVKLGSARLPSTEVLFSRFFIGLIFMLPLIKKDKNFSLKVNKKWYLLLRNGAGLLSMGLTFYALKYLPVSTSILLMNTLALFVPLLSFIFFRTKITLPILGCTLLGFLGVYIILNASADAPIKYLLIGLSGAITAALAFLGIQQLNKYNSPLQIVFYFYLTSTIIVPIVFGYTWVMPTLKEFLILLGVGFFGLVFQMNLTKAFKFPNSNMITPFVFTGVIFSSLLDWVYWDHKPPLNFWIGALVIVVAISVLARLKSNKN